MSKPLNGDHFRANIYKGSFSTIGASEYRSVSGNIELTQTEISINLTIIGPSGERFNEKIWVTFSEDVTPQSILDRIESVASDYFF